MAEKKIRKSLRQSMFWIVFYSVTFTRNSNMKFRWLGKNNILKRPDEELKLHDRCYSRLTRNRP